jgi:hypothetical protein
METPFDQLKSDFDRRLEEAEARRLKLLHSARGRLGCLVSFLVLAVAAWALVHWLNQRWPGLIHDGPPTDFRELQRAAFEENR